MGDFAGFCVTKDQGHFYYERQDATVNICFVHHKFSACDIQYISVLCGEKYVTPNVVWTAPLLPESVTTLLSNVSLSTADIFFSYQFYLLYMTRFMFAFLSVECARGWKNKSQQLFIIDIKFIYNHASHVAVAI